MKEYNLYLNDECTKFINILDRCTYESEMLKEIIKFCIAHPNDIPLDIVKYWDDLYLESSYRLESMKELISEELLSAFKHAKISWNHSFGSRDIKIIQHDDSIIDNFDDMERFRPVEPSRPDEYSTMITRLYPELFGKDIEEINNMNSDKKVVRTITFQVTDSCNLACTYCYQINKGTRKMSFDTAKRIVDLILTPNTSTYISEENSPAIILDFIGGEPLLQVELIDKIVEYFMLQSILRKHKWATMFRISICSNGVLYTDKKVQSFLNKYNPLLSFGVTVDGNKELHDSCRIFPDGKPSYDLAISAVTDYITKGHEMGSKVTIAPENVEYISKAIIHMFNTDYSYIHANCCFEEGWNLDHAKTLYIELKKIADFILNNDKENKIYFSMFNVDNFKPTDLENDRNWCGGNGSMIAFDPDGEIYSCIRFMKSSLGTSRESKPIGDINTGIAVTQKQQDFISELYSITLTSQSTDTCINCPIGTGCAWCTAYNYQYTGSVNKRVTFICDMHKATALANVYYWNKVYIKHNINKSFVNNCPDNWAIEIIGKDELNLLKKLEKESIKYEN